MTDNIDKQSISAEYANMESDFAQPFKRTLRMTSLLKAIMKRGHDQVILNSVYRASKYICGLLCPR